MLKLIIFFAVCLATISANTEYQQPFAWWDTDDNKEYKDQSHRTPFPECLLSGSKSNYLESSSLQKLFDQAIGDEEKNLVYERYENKKHNYDDLMDYDAYGSRSDYGKSRAIVSATTRLTKDIMTILACDLKDTNSENLEKFLQQFKTPEKFCRFREKPDCTGKTAYRTATGLCNNIEKPYEGSSQTAFGRILSPDYDDYLSEPRRRSCRGGLLPSCRRLSLALGSRPAFSREYNNFFVIFGQFIGHDMALSTPVTDTYLTPITSCTCSAKYDWNKCTVIDVAPNDPYFGGQKCMAFPATAQAFKNQVCSLGVKEQMNGNTHFLDLSNVYGNTLRSAAIVRSDNGLLKSTRRHWSKHELPPGQREGKSCTDATYKQPCLAGGDSRLMVSLLFTGIHTMFLRGHNQVAKKLNELNPLWDNNRLYEEARKIMIAIFQRAFYHDWLQILLGDKEHAANFLTPTETHYDDTVSPVVFNEVATAGFRLHTLVRDLFTRVTPDGKRIDLLWLHDISHKAKYAYDIDAYGLDSIIAGSFYDPGFAFDGNFAHQIHNRLFETVNQYKQLWRNDLVAINICRGREHGIRNYNAYREYCGLPKAQYFEEFSDTINHDGIKLLKSIYKAPCDVDLFVGLNLEDPVQGGVVGPTTACLLTKQFKVLRDGDRLFYSHENVFTPIQLTKIISYRFACFICDVVHIDEVPTNPFKPPNDADNPLIKCDTCAPLDLGPWKE